jgi:2-polyprenyl-3-methyl-5-hydroxy-6-metoxy-1,4-benzoquinol methylase
MLPTIDEQTKSWNHWITTHVELAKPNPASEYAAEWALSKAPRTGAYLRVMEVGCADGWFCRKLIPTAYKVVGFDLPTEALSRAKARLPQVEFVGGDICNYSPEKKLHAIYCLQTLPHIADHNAFAKAVAGMLHPGGKLILTCQNRYVFSRMAWVNTGNPGQIRKWPSSAELFKTFNPYFKVLELTTLYPGDGHMGLLRLVNSPRLNSLAKAIVGDKLVTRLKEALGFGQFLAMYAKVR